MSTDMLAQLVQAEVMRQQKARDDEERAYQRMQDDCLRDFREALRSLLGKTLFDNASIEFLTPTHAVLRHNNHAINLFYRWNDRLLMLGTGTVLSSREQVIRALARSILDTTEAQESADAA